MTRGLQCHGLIMRLLTRSSVRFARYPDGQWPRLRRHYRQARKPLILNVIM